MKRNELERNRYEKKGTGIAVDEMKGVGSESGERNCW